MISLFLISVLTTIFLSAVLNKARMKAELIECQGHMISLGGALGSYHHDHHQWPQMPEDAEAGGSDDEESYWKWWQDTLRPYGVDHTHWMCRTDNRLIASKIPDEDRPAYESSYLPTDFDEREMTPFQWPQPWVMERGQFHGTGIQVLMPDGTLKMQTLGLPGAY
jgi:hypothetical protein